MGIKDNFQQALRELTGTDKSDSDTSRRDKPIDVMKNAVDASDTSEFDAIKEIDRRAAEAASEYDRQQRAYLGGDPMTDNTPYSGDASYNGQTGASLGVNGSEQPLSLGNEQASSHSPESQSFNNTQPGQDIGLSFGSDKESTSSYFRNDGNVNAANQQGGVNNGYRQQSANTGYRQQNSGYQQRPGNGGYQQQGESGYMGGANNPAHEQQQIFAGYPNHLNDEEEITVISKNTVIDGNVRSFANMAVDGNIKGNIETTKDIDLNGKIVGNIACNNAQMRTSQIQGNIQMKGNAYMERDTLLIGDLTSTYANVNGKIKGNLDITGKAELKSDAVVFGDISASTITVNDGAIIQGYVSTTFLNKEESKNIFPDTITIGE